MLQTLGNDEEFELDSAKWTDLLDRGGLICVSDMTYTLFSTKEIEFRHHFVITRIEEDLSSENADK